MSGNGDWIKVARAQRGWIAEACVSVCTSEQFATISLPYRTGGRWALTAFIKCWFGAKRMKRRREREDLPKRLMLGWF